MSEWVLDHGTWRWRSPSGAYFRITYQGGRYHAVINRSQGLPERLGAFPSLGEAKTACAECGVAA